MEIIKGRVNTIGNSRTTGSSELYSLLEIGNHQLKNLTISSYLDNYLEQGTEVELLVYKGMLSKLILGIKVNNKVHKTPWTGMLTSFILKTLCVAPILFLIPYMLIQPSGDSDTYMTWGIGIVLTGIYLLFKIRHVMDLAKF